MGLVCLGEAGVAGSGRAWMAVAWSGLVRQARRGARRSGLARQVWRGLAGFREARSGKVGPVWLRRVFVGRDERLARIFHQDYRMVTEVVEALRTFGPGQEQSRVALLRNASEAEDLIWRLEADVRRGR